MSPDPSLLVPDDFTRVPSAASTVEVSAVDALDEAALDAVVVLVPSDGDLIAGGAPCVIHGTSDLPHELIRGKKAA